MYRCMGLGCWGEVPRPRARIPQLPLAHGLIPSLTLSTLTLSLHALSHSLSTHAMENNFAPPPLPGVWRA